MDKLKAVLVEAENEQIAKVNDRVEVVGLTIASSLNRGCQFLGVDLSQVDYEIVEKGKQSFLSPKPYRILVFRLPPESRYLDLEEFAIKIGAGDRMLGSEIDRYEPVKHRDGRVYVRNYRSGVFIVVEPPIGGGTPVDINQANVKITHAGIQNVDIGTVEKAIKKMSGEPVKIAPYTPKPDADSTVKVEVTPDNMKAFVRIIPPKSGGRNLEVGDVVAALRAQDVVIGYLEDNIKDALLEEKYNQEILGAQGVPVKHGADAYIDYKVDIHKDRANLEEDQQGRVDFKQLNLVENVVVGQILAVKVPAERGKMGKNLSNRLVEARDGKDVELKQGKGTILSEDKKKLIAEINGQVVYSGDKISVEPVFRVQGDVGPKTGNIMFLGSVQITGNVLDNYEVKAAGNIEVQGAIQKARVEAEGDIIARAGVIGHEGYCVESTGGGLIAKFIQNAEINVTGDVMVQEGILHSKVDSGGKIICNGRRAQIVGGRICATKEVRARIIGSQSYTATEIVVGTDPRILAQKKEFEEMLKEVEKKLSVTKKTVQTLQARKDADAAAFTPEQDSDLNDKQEQITVMEDRKVEIAEEIKQLVEHINRMAADGKVHAEKEVFPGVTIEIKDASQTFNDSYRAATFSYDNGYVKVNKLEKAEEPASSTGHGRRRN